MTVPPRRPRFPDIQPPKLYRAGITLRRGYPLGPTETQEEDELKGLLEQADRPAEEKTILQPRPPRD